MLAWALERFLAATRDIRGPNTIMVRLTNNLSSVYWNLLKNQYFVSSFRSRDENSSRRLIPFSHRSEFQLGRYSRRLVRGCRHGGSDAQRFVLPLEIIVREVQTNRRAIVPFYERTLLRRSSLLVFHAS